MYLEGWKYEGMMAQDSKYQHEGQGGWGQGGGWQGQGRQSYGKVIVHDTTVDIRDASLLLLEDLEPSRQNQEKKINFGFCSSKAFRGCNKKIHGVTL